MTHILSVLVLTLLAQHPNLSGHWVVNAALSQNPRDMMQGRDSGGGDPRGGRMGGGGGRGGFGGRRGGFGGGRGGYGGREGGGGGMSEQQRVRMRQTMQLVFTAPASLAIVTTDSTLTLDADGDTLVLPTSGRKVRREPTVQGEGAVDIKGHWQGNDFVVERSVSGGGKVTEDYLRSTDGQQLFVLVTFEAGRREVTFRRIYDSR
jgi:hypothetical protein